MESLTGQIVDGKYRVGRRLGEGGMGAVYLAEHIGIGRHVALKIVRPELLSEPTAAERFQREARAAGAIQHRNVADVTDFGIARVSGSDSAYLVMEQLHGQTLEEVLEERRRLPFRGSTVELLRAHFVSEVPAFGPESGINVEVGNGVRRALSKGPDDRFQSAPAFAAALRANSMGFGESMRSAIALFAERLPELTRVGVFFALAGITATIVGALLWPVPMIWFVLLTMSFLVSGPMAMASIAAIFDDVKYRPFVPTSGRQTAIAVVRHDASVAALLTTWVRTTTVRDFSATRQAKGSSIGGRRSFIDLFRHRGARAGEARVTQMAQVLPKGAFATMAVAQLLGVFIAPMLAMLAAYGLLRLVGQQSLFLIARTGSLAFTAMLFLQTFIALVDVMLYDLAYDMTAE